MNIIFEILELYTAVYIGLQILFFVSFHILERNERKHINNFPTVSILVAARNEAHQIVDCIKALEQLDYPPDKIEILIGDDASDDGTFELIQEYIQNHKSHQFSKYIQCFSIKENLGHARAKANVLAHLARVATGEFLLITDADIKVHPQWIQTLIASFDEQTGIVSGTTLIIPNSNSVLELLQSYDWLYFSALLQAISNLNIPVTAVGNNMAVRKSAYLSTGGYENIPFSVTEDLALYNSIRKNGWKTVNTFHKKSINLTKCCNQISDLFSQRKRWLKGGQDLSILTQCILFYYGLFPFVFIGLFILNPVIGITVYVVRLIIQSGFIIWVGKKTEMKVSIIQLFLYDILQVFFNMVLGLYYLLPISFQWKKRKY